MLGKKSKPVIGILAGSLVPGQKPTLVDNILTSSRTLLQPKIQSPTGLKSFDLGGVGVGLGIVAALEKSGEEKTVNRALFGRHLSRSSPIPVTPTKNSASIRRDWVEMEMGSSEEYSIVTSHRTNMSHVQVYYDMPEDGRTGEYRTPFRIQNNSKSKRASVFQISPARSEEDSGIPATDFLNSCDMCQKKLHGKDIYMYRGEKAFCSTECRYKVIAMDERQEKCSWEASRSMDLPSSPLASGHGPIFTTGILAT